MVVGATSSLAQALCRTLAARGHTLVLAGRDEGELDLLASDIQVRYGITCRIVVVDVLDHGFAPDAFLNDAGDFDDIIITLGDMAQEDMYSPNAIAYAIHVNYTAVAVIASLAAEKLARKHSGSVVIISSVAGDRGRQSNYPYGAAKAAVTAFASGLRNRYCKQGVHVMTVKPGFIDTPMTWGMQSPLIASREYVARKIANAMGKKKDMIYVPFFWQFIMLIICHIPERIFKKLSL